MNGTRHRLKDGSAVLLRRLTREDGPAIGEMLADCSETTYRYFHPYPLTRESGERVAADGRIHCFLALADAGRVVGYAWIGQDEECPTLGICVRDGWQGRGVGRLLMERLVDEARRLGKTAVQLTVMQDNTRAIALYKSLGFVVDGDAADAFGPAHHMTLTLG